MSWLIDRLVDWWMARCPHAGGDVAADILEGAALPRPGIEVQLCRRCGATRIANVDMCCIPERSYSAWRRPRPMWSERYEVRAMARDQKAGRE